MHMWELPRRQTLAWGVEFTAFQIHLLNPKATGERNNLRLVSSDYLSHREATLRRSELSKWAKMIKPVTKAPFGFSAGWFTPPDGPPRRRLTAVEARKGAAQEWSKLMIEPSCKWHHPLITQYKDECGRPRGTINLEVACNAPPGDNIRDTALAYMGSSKSGYSIVY